MDTLNKSKTYSQRTLLIVASMLILFIGVWFIFAEIWGQVGKIFYLQAKISQAKKEKNLQEQKLAKVQKIFDEFQTQEATRATISLSLPVEADYGQILSEIYSIADLSGLSVKKESFSEKLSETELKRKKVYYRSKVNRTSENLIKPYSVIAINFEGSGTYSQIKNFLKLIEKDIRLMDLESFDLSKLKASQSQGESNWSSEFDPEVSFKAVIDAYKQEKE